jgi:N-acetylglucosamine kinase-like BadF-type ATPase
VDKLVLGLDIGGSSSRARLVAGDRIVAEATGPGANVAVIAPSHIRERLSALIRDLGSPKPVACCAGAAGAEVPAGRARLERLLSALLPKTSVTVVHDARLVLAAAGLESGIALIAGTGSVAYGRTRDGREARVGGWGWLLGDDGSGMWIVREAARDVMRRRDAGEPPGPLGESLMEATETREVLELTGKLHSFREPGRWAALSGAVFRAVDQDEGARDIVSRAAYRLAALVGEVRTRLELAGPLVLSGGLLLNEARLESLVRERVGGGQRLTEPPVAGAVRIAVAIQPVRPGRAAARASSSPRTSDLR